MRRKLPEAAQALAAISRATGRGRGRRSPLYLWFRDHHDELAAGFARNAPAWQHLAKFLGEHGVLDVDGKLPTARGARDAWWRVRRDMKKAEMATLPEMPLKLDSMPPGVRVVAPSPSLPSKAGRLFPELSPLPDTRPRMPPIKFKVRQPM